MKAPKPKSRRTSQFQAAKPVRLAAATPVPVRAKPEEPATVPMPVAAPLHAPPAPAPAPPLYAGIIRCVCVECGREVALARATATTRPAVRTRAVARRRVHWAARLWQALRVRFLVGRRAA